MKHKIQGAFAEYIDGVIQQKHAGGFIYHEGERILRRFSDFCNLRFPEKAELTEDIVQKWIASSTDYSGSYQMYKMSAVRNLGIYMRGMGQDAYVLPKEMYPRLNPRYVPYIYSHDELASIFNCADNRAVSKLSPLLHLVLPVIIRLLYCCGLRPGEALKLQVNHVNLENGELHIMESKGLKDRLVLMSADMTALCKKYHETVNALYPGMTYFFPNVHTNGRFLKSWFDFNFRQLLQRAKLEYSSVSKPRLYDFRHTFATHCIQKWIDEGADVNAKLLYLSAYMGHKDVTNTAYYIHLIPAEFRKQSKLSTEWYAGIALEAADEN